MPSFTCQACGAVFSSQYKLVKHQEEKIDGDTLVFTNAPTICAGYLKNAIGSTIALPAETGTLATLDGIETFSRKLFDADTCAFMDSTDNSKLFKFDLGRLSPEANITIDVPNANDEMAMVNAGQMLNNKALSTSCYFVDVNDTTKSLTLDLAGITTGTTRGLSIPNASGTITLTTATQSLTNKTVSGKINLRPTSTITASSVTLDLSTSAAYSSVAVDTTANVVTINNVSSVGLSVGDLVAIHRINSGANNLVIAHNNTTGGVAFFNKSAANVTATGIGAYLYIYNGSVFAQF